MYMIDIFSLVLFYSILFHKRTIAFYIVKVVKGGGKVETIYRVVNDKVFLHCPFLANPADVSITRYFFLSIYIYIYLQYLSLFK